MSDTEDFLSGSAVLFGEAAPEDDRIHYGPLLLTVAPKEGKANTLLADHLFSPSLLLAELIERGIISLGGKTVVELGAGCALPSLLSGTLFEPPSLTVITDYPDDTIMKNLLSNVERNRPHYNEKCTVHALGYEWGTDVSPLLALADGHTTGRADGTVGFDAVIMSDLLHFDGSHDVLVRALTALLRRAPAARAYVAAGKYTAPRVCEHFVQEAARVGVVLEEQDVDEGWKGALGVRGGGLDREQLGVRKGMSRWWVGRWADC